MKKKLFITVLTLFIIQISLCAAADKYEKILEKGKKFLSSGEKDRGFLYLRQVIHEAPQSIYADEAQFLIAEYYFQVKNYFQAQKEFKTHLTKYPDSSSREKSLQYLSKIEVKVTEEQANRACEEGDYEKAESLLTEILKRDPENAFAKKKLEEIQEILGKTGYAGSISGDGKKGSQQSKLLAAAYEEISKLKLELETTKQEAKNTVDQMQKKYQKLLNESNMKNNELELKIEQLEADLQTWRQRAKEYEAKILADSNLKELTDDTEKIIFEGYQKDPHLAADEQQVTDPVLEKSPSVVLLGEYLDTKTNVLKAEIVASVDLETEWKATSNYLLKLRFDFNGIAENDGDTKKINPKIVYYDLFDMDDVNMLNHSYRKKVIVAMDKNEVKGYNVSAFFIRKKTVIE